MAWNQAEIDICQEALMILRQDIDLPTPEGADADNTLEWKKCKLVFKRAVNEVVDAYKWGNVTHGSVTEPIGASNVQHWPEKLKNALVYCLARELAVPIAGRVADMRDCDALYRDKLLTAQLVVLNERLVENADPILAELIGNFRSDDPGLVKAYEVYTQRVAAVEQNSVNTVAEILGITLEEEEQEEEAAEKRPIEKLTGYAKDAAISHAVAKLAGACGLDANFVSLKNQQFEARLLEAKKQAIESAAENTTATTGVLVDCLKEVRSTLGIDASAGDYVDDDLVIAAAQCLVYVRRGAKVYDANFLQLKEGEYASKIQEYRKLRLNKALQENDDPVLGEILANFRSDDAALVNAFEIYTKRVDLVKSVAVQEINIAHEWHKGAFSTEATSHVAYPAYLALCAAKLVIACGLTGDAAKLYEARYQAKLREARIKDLEDTKIEDAVTKDVFALVRGNFAEDAALPRSITAFTAKIDQLKPMARREVLSSHDWSFALEDMIASAVANPHPDPVYPYHASLPGDCLTISAVYDGEGRVTQWKRTGEEIRSKTPITRIVYLRDIENEKEYPAKVYRAFILRLVADLAMSLASSPKDRQYQEQLARDALNDAIMSDSRDSNTPDEAWGKNELADSMLWGSEDPLDRR